MLNRDPQDVSDMGVDFYDRLSDALIAKGLDPAGLSDATMDDLFVEWAEGERSFEDTVDIAAETLRGE